MERSSREILSENNISITNPRIIVLGQLLKYKKPTYVEDLQDNLKGQVATSTLYRVLNDLMGLDGYYSTGNKNSAGQIIETTVEASPFKNTGLNGPKIDYYNVGKVGWQGLNGLVEYQGDKLTAVVQAGLSNQAFQRIDYFDQPGNPESDVQNQGGGYVKGGANYNIDEKSK